MWFLPYDGAARHLADRVSLHRSFGSHEELVTVLDLDDDLVGRMFAIDPETLAERRLDENVFGPSLGPRSRALGDGSILYSIVDGDRSGVWHTRLRQSD
jgi:hypothetical protein